MRVLIAGSGGREHALAWRLRRDPSVTAIVCAPGNAGIATIAQTVAIDPADPDALLALTERESIDLTVIGPELPLDRGVVDRFRVEGRRILGPPRVAAQLECSKAFAKGFMARHGIPTARYRVCETSDEARATIDRGEFGFPVVLKADGLAAGKGVVIAADRAEAHTAIRAAMDDRQFGAAGARLVIEECMSGPEVSFFALCDGTRAIPIATAQDHKRIFDDDRGPNTGGMGAFSPSPLVDAAMQARIMREIVGPTVAGLATSGAPYRGVLYVGLMLTKEGPKVVEFNCRFGDPESQVMLPRMEGDLVPLLFAVARGERPPVAPWTSGRRASVCVAIASGGYPGRYATGIEITGIGAAEAVPGVQVFHAGTAIREGRLVTAGGRVLGVTATGADLPAAIAAAYDAARRIHFDGMHYRRDIGRRALGEVPGS